MAVKWSTPGIGFSEIDNSIQANTTMADGVGAIVINANQGYVNQRVLSTSRKRFHEQFGDQETSGDYGHFAADQYLAASPQLYAVRATMGDEQYGFIQFPYDDAAARDCKIDALQQTFEYVDNEGVTQIKLLKPMLSKGIEYSAVSGEYWQTFTGKNVGADISTLSTAYYNTAFCLVDNGYGAIYSDLQYDLDPAMHIFRDDGSVFNANGQVITTNKGKYYQVVDSTDQKVKLFLNAKALTTVDATKTYVFSSMSDLSNVIDNLGNHPYVVRTSDFANSTYGTNSYEMFVPNELTMNEDPAGTSISFWAKSDWSTFETIVTAKDGTTTAKAYTAYVSTIPDNIATSTIVASAETIPCQLYDWNDNAETNKMIVDVNCFSNAKGVSGAQYREITGALYNQSLMTTSASNTLDLIYLNDVPFTSLDASVQAQYSNVLKNGFEAKAATDYDYARLKDLAYNSYGKNVAEINTSAYKVFTMLDATTLNIEEKIVFANNPNDNDANKDDGIFVSPFIFNTYVDEDLGIEGERVVNAAYVSRNPEVINLPWQYEESTDKVAKLVAYPSSEVLNDPSGIYKDGYTKTILTVDEPGNGDIERYDSKQNNQLVIASVGPGEYGNNIGISIITPAVAGNMALENEQAAFNWKYQFDDEDLVEKDWKENPTYKSNPYNLTWKKVYKINVYVKSKTQQASVWGSGLDALVKEPVESFLVSNDPSVKDGNGNSMYAPYVINGQSKYIYVSLKSVIDSRTNFGTYAMPKQTYSIYQLKGGANSKLNNIKEKTAALELYREREKCKFDIIFNVDPIETFQSRQKYAAMQNRIAEIASDRGMDIGFIQVTSKAARTGYKALSEGKLFSFQNGSYVACEAGYDRYYDSYTSNWVYLPKSVAMAIAHARCWVTGTPWMAPAGIKRGTIDYTNGQLLKLSDTEIGQLYDANINCSRTCSGYGEVIWCQKTALKKTSALNRINVRGLVNYIEKNLEQMLIPYLYQMNTTATRSNMRSTVDAFLSNIMAAEGIIAKQVVVKADPEDSHLVYVNISIIPAETIEFIQVTTTINRQNATITSSEA